MPFVKTTRLLKALGSIPPGFAKLRPTVQVSKTVKDLVTIGAFQAFYRRPGGDTIYARDGYGRFMTFRIEETETEGTYRVGLLAARNIDLGPTYGRFDFQNRLRFSGRTRGPSTLKADYKAAKSHKEQPETNLPSRRCSSRRTADQGMEERAVDYYNSVTARNEGARSFEWCHLVAHSMGGLDLPSNIVCARRGNNSEQLVIENTLSMYHMEGGFSVQVSASLVADTKHLGDVIRYGISAAHIDESLVIYLDCKAPIAPSAIHCGFVANEVARYCNDVLVRRQSKEIRVTKAEIRLIKRFARVRILEELEGAKLPTDVAAV